MLALLAAAGQSQPAPLWRAVAVVGVAPYRLAGQAALRAPCRVKARVGAVLTDGLTWHLLARRAAATVAAMALRAVRQLRLARVVVVVVVTLRAARVVRVCWRSTTKHASTAD